MRRFGWASGMALVLMENSFSRGWGERVAEARISQESGIFSGLTGLENWRAPLDGALDERVHDAAVDSQRRTGRGGCEGEAR
jgi:hypothetical protein